MEELASSQSVYMNPSFRSRDSQRQLDAPPKARETSPEVARGYVSLNPLSIDPRECVRLLRGRMTVWIYKALHVAYGVRYDLSRLGVFGILGERELAESVKEIASENPQVSFRQSLVYRRLSRSAQRLLSPLLQAARPHQLHPSQPSRRNARDNRDNANEVHLRGSFS